MKKSTKVCCGGLVVVNTKDFTKNEISHTN